jgi:hypothetical protein
VGRPSIEKKKYMKMIYNNTNKVDRLLSSGHQYHLGHLRGKMGPGTLRPLTPINTTICNACRRSSEVIKNLQATAVFTTVHPLKQQ